MFGLALGFPVPGEVLCGVDEFGVGDGIFELLKGKPLLPIDDTRSFEVGENVRVLEVSHKEGVSDGVVVGYNHFVDTLPQLKIVLSSLMEDCLPHIDPCTHKIY